MRDQYAGDVSDVLKFAFLRALAGADRNLGIAWYYAPGHDGRPDGQHLEWRNEPAWRLLDENCTPGLRRCRNAALPHLNRRRSGQQASCFIANRCHPAERSAWGTQKRNVLEGADLVFLDPDNGIGKETLKARDLLGNPAAPQIRTRHRLHHVSRSKHEAR